MDNLMYYGEAEEFIIVVPNGRSSVSYQDRSFANMNGFYFFGQELRNDLIPYIDKNFATYAEYDENGYDLTATRDHRAMAGLSMGGKSSSKTSAPQTKAGIDLKEFYAKRQFEYGFASVCKMTLPVDSLKGKKILDLCCRRGKGAYKLSAMAGNEGSVMGVDWSAAYIEEAKDGMEHAWRKSNLARNNMEFRVAFPEDLIAAGVGTSTMDVAYVNYVNTLFADPAKAISELVSALQ